MKTLSLALVVGLVGCQSAKFILTDNNFTPTPKAVPPTVWIDVLPSAPFHPVGTIEVVLSADAADQDFVAAALSAAQKAGCDVLVDPRLGGTSWRLPANGWIILTHEGGEGPPARDARAREKPDQHRNYVCGITVAAPST